MKKKYLLVYLPFLLMLVLIYIAYTPVCIAIDNQEINFSINPIIIHKSIMVPAEQLANALQFNYKNLSDNTIIISNGYKETIFSVGSNVFLLNNQQIRCETQPLIIEGKILIPLKEVIKSFNLNYQLQKNNKSIFVTIKSPQ